jgi:hypothetical protein
LSLLRLCVISGEEFTMAPRGGNWDGDWHWARDEWTQVAQTKADEALAQANATGKHNFSKLEERLEALAEKVDAQGWRLKDAEDERVLLLRQLETQERELASMEKLHQDLLEAHDDMVQRDQYLEVRADDQRPPYQPVQEPPTVPMTFTGAPRGPFVSALSQAPQLPAASAGAGAAPTPSQQAPPQQAPAPPQWLPAPAVPGEQAPPQQAVAGGLIIDSWMPEHRHFRRGTWQSPPVREPCQHAKYGWFINCFNKYSPESLSYFVSARDVQKDHWTNKLQKAVHISTGHLRNPVPSDVWYHVVHDDDGSTRSVFAMAQSGIWRILSLHWLCQLQFGHRPLSTPKSCG